MAVKRALVLGCSGQAGSWLIELLLAKGYAVIGTRRRASTPNLSRIEHLLSNLNLTLRWADMTDRDSLRRVIEESQPDEIYNLAAQSVRENEFLPVLKCLNLSVTTFGELWNEIVKKNPKINKVIIKGVETEVIEVRSSLSMRALGMWNATGMWMPIKQISRHRYKGKLANVHQKMGSVSVTPNHCLLDAQQQPCKASDNKELLAVRHIAYLPRRELKKVKIRYRGCRKEIGDWHYPMNMRSRDIVKASANGTEEISALCRFIAAFVSEGSTCYNKANRSYVVNISNNNKRWLDEIEKDVRMFFKGRIVYRSSIKGRHNRNWSMVIHSRFLYNLMREWCGVRSPNKKLPDWIFQCPEECKKILWTKMNEGDGRKTYRNNYEYKTVSRKLACQCGMLLTLLGRQYVTHCSGKKNNPNWNPSYSIKESFYSIKPKENLEAGRIEYEEYDGWVYDLGIGHVQNFAIGVGNIVVHNSHVAVSFVMPDYTRQTIYNGTMNLLDICHAMEKRPRIFLAGSSEMYGNAPAPQNEDTMFHPVSPYATAKLDAFRTAQVYRSNAGMWIAQGILFNYESPRRGEQFVTRKITRALGRMACGLQETCSLGNLDSRRDWGHARDSMEAVWLMMQQEDPDDFVIATGETHSVREFLDVACSYLSVEHHFMGFRHRFTTDPSLLRPAEVHCLQGDASKARRVLGWKPRTEFRSLVSEMVQADYELAQVEAQICAFRKS